MSEKRPPLGTRFRVLVVADDHVARYPELTIPTLVRSADKRSPWIAVAAEAEPGHVGASPWAFGGRSRVAVIRQLRELADWLEKQ